MHYFIFIICCLFIFTNISKADILPSDTTNQLNTDVLDNEGLVEDEIVKLRKEVDNLNTELKQKEEAEENLKKELTQYQTQQQLQQDYNSQLTDLQQTILKEPFLTKDIEDGDYNLAYQSVSLGNIKYAEEHLKLFVNKDFKSVSLEGFGPTVPQVSENTNVPGDTDKSNNIAQQNAANTKTEQKKEYLLATQNLKDKAYYILGVINLINLDPKEAINNLSQAYKESNKANLVLLSLVKIIKAFDMLERKDEVCLTVKNFNSTLNQVQEADNEFTFPPQYITPVKETAVKYNCK